LIVEHLTLPGVLDGVLPGVSVPDGLVDRIVAAIVPDGPDGPDVPDGPGSPNGTGGPDGRWPRLASPASPASEAARARARSRRPRGTCRHDGTAEPGRARGRGGRAGEGEDAGRGCRAAPSGHKTSTGTPRARAKATRWAVASRPSDGEPSHTASSRLPSATIRSSARTQASRSA